jgi:SAM-dependent methyltransferase
LRADARERQPLAGLRAIVISSPVAGLRPLRSHEHHRHLDLLARQRGARPEDVLAVRTRGTPVHLPPPPVRMRTAADTVRSMPGKISDLLWGPLFARGYDRFNKIAEDAGLREKRRALLARAHGRTLEIGAGTGINLELYPNSVTELVLAEPDPHMRGQLEKRLSALRRHAEILDAGGERLPLPDASIDTAVATLVLCTIPDPAGALTEIARVLKPGGQLLFLEHVRSDNPKVTRWQDRLERPWGWFGRGCHPNRDTLATIRDSTLAMREIERDRIPKAPPIVRPLIVGEATLPGQP